MLSPSHSTASTVSIKTSLDAQNARIQRILIVEDESVVACDLQGRLENLGYDVCGIADTYEDAVEQALTLSPDLILMDIHLIGLKDGVDAAKKIRQSHAIPIVFLTAHADNATITRIEAAEPFGYVVKPFEEQELRATIEVALYRARAEKHLKNMEASLSAANSQLLNTQKQLEFMVQHDNLTGCFNRNYLNAAFESVLTCVSHGHSAALLCVDVDDFKIVNDIGGHPGGDHVLVACSKVMKSAISEQDILLRMGGDEFLIFLKNADVQQACEIAEKIRKQVEESTFCFEDHRLKVTVSIGVSRLHSESSQKQLIGSSDSACYAAKAKGRNCVVNRDLLELEADPCNWKSKVDSAIDDDRLELWFQPVIELASQKPCMYEAFLRPRTEAGLIANPAPYLRAAERYKIETEIDKHVIQKAVIYLTRFSDRKLAINISAQSISSRTMGGFIEQLFEERSEAASRLCFEISEASLISDINAASDFMKRLVKRGFTFSLDNFGERCSPFYYLTTLPIQYIKIDGRYIVGLEKEPANQLIVRGINNIAHDLNIKTIAEHVETVETLGILTEMKIDFAQGYYLGHPMAWH